MTENKDREILEAVLSEIKTLKSIKKTGKIQLTLELHMSQGAIGSAFIDIRTREDMRAVIGE